MIKLEPNPTSWDLKWRLCGIPVRVHPLFWLVALLWGYADGKRFIFVLATIAAIFISVLIHELGHALCQRHYGDRQNYIVLYALGGLSIGRAQAGLRPRLAVLFCGPGAELLLGALAYGAWKVVKFSPDTLVYQLVCDIFWISLIWGLANLLPIFPLDGGQVVREIIAHKAPQRGDAFAFKISFFAAVAAAILAALWAIYHYRQNLQFVCLFPTLIFALLAWQSYSLRRQIIAYGPSDSNEGATRQPWERDGDWWKNS
jgi:Zn-dependent protease